MQGREADAHDPFEEVTTVNEFDSLLDMCYMSGLVTDNQVDALHPIVEEDGEIPFGIDALKSAIRSNFDPN